MVLILIHGDRSYAHAAAEAGKKLLAGLIEITYKRRPSQ